jgi:hypothetical protein
MPIPGIVWGVLSMLPQLPALSRGFTNTASTVSDAFKKKGLAGVIDSYASGDAGKAYYSGMMTGGNGLMAPQKGDPQTVSGQVKFWDPVNGYQLKDTKGTSTRVSPIKYSATGAPIDPKTGQTRTGNIVDPATVVDEPETLATVSPPVIEEVVDTSKAQAAAKAAVTYQKAKKEDDRLLELHKGYKTMREFGGEPVVTQEYMEQDAMREWAKANPLLAEKLIKEKGLSKEGIFTENGNAAPAPAGSPLFGGVLNASQNIAFPVMASSQGAISPGASIGNLAGLTGSVLGSSNSKSGFYRATDAPVVEMPEVGPSGNPIAIDDPEGKYAKVFAMLSGKN